MLKRISFSAALGLILLSLIIAFVAVVGNLKAQVYTPSQRHFIESNVYKNIAQRGVEVNFVAPAGALMPASIGALDNHISAELEVRYEDRGGVTLTFYDLDFVGLYRIANPAQATMNSETKAEEAYASTITAELFFPFPGTVDMLHNVQFLVDGKEPADAQYSLQGIRWQTTLSPEEEREIEVRYKAKGVGSFAYSLDHNRRIRNLDAEIKVRGVAGTEVPNHALAPSAHTPGDDGDVFSWQYQGLIADQDIAIELPTMLSLSQKVEKMSPLFTGLSFLAPALMVSFLACLAVALRLSEVRLRLEHYLLMGLGFFLFYPLLIFLASVLGLTAAAALSLLVIGALILVFLRKVESSPQIWVYAALLMVVFLGLFSLGLLTRWRGLLLTAGGILLVGFFMQLAARLKAREPASPPISLGEESPSVVEAAVEVEETAEQVTEETFDKFCPRCGRGLLPDYTFCPGCGHDERAFLACQHCGRQHYAADRESLAFCPGCGTRF
ncbi:MAG: hypothetical protein ACETWR_17870 [Anaerolineae bacterium]